MLGALSQCTVKYNSCYDLLTCSTCDVYMPFMYDNLAGTEHVACKAYHAYGALACWEDRDGRRRVRSVQV